MERFINICDNSTEFTLHGKSLEEHRDRNLFHSNISSSMTNEDVSLILSGVITFATVCYTVINLMVWYESRATRRQKLAPQVIPFLRSTASNITLSLHIKNVGEGLLSERDT